MLLLVLGFALIVSSCKPADSNRIPNVTVDQIKTFASDQLVLLINETDAAIELNPNSNRGPHVNSRAFRDGSLFLIPSRDWTSGFMPGIS
jgi:hypothetical protein